MEHGASGDGIDFDLHGLAGVRLVGATPRDAAAVESQLGPLRRPLDREPDLVIRFVDRLELEGAVRLLGLDDAGFTDDAFLILRGKHKSRVKVELPLDALGSTLRITCERGARAVPLLVPLINATVLANGVLPLHGAAFVHEGTGVVATGWSKGGKTESLVAFAQHGARYVGDEWVYVDAAGERVWGISEPVRLWHWYVRQLGGGGLARRERARLGALTTAARLARAGDRVGLLRRSAALLEGQLHVDVEPARLFAGGAAAMPAPFDRLFILVSHDADEVTVEPVDPLDVADRMGASLAYERAPLVAAYQKFRFAFPGTASPVLDEAADRERVLLRSAFAGKPAFVVRHPYPADLDALFGAMRPHC